MCKTEQRQQQSGNEPATSCPESAQLWRIHGQDYDLSSFAKVHPGGAVAVKLGQGSDCTRLFESYHVMNDRHRQVLQRYASAVPDGSFEARSCNFGHVGLVGPAQSAFHADVKALFRKHFKGGGASAHKAKSSHAVAMAMVLVGYAAAWLGWFRGSYTALLLLPFLAWLVMANLAHDGSHFAVSRRPWVNQLCLYGSSPLYYTDATWYMQHVVSHHLETNSFKGDVDLHHHGSVRWHPDKTRAKGLEGCRNLFWHATAFTGSTLILALVQPLTKFVLPGLFVKLGTPAPRLWGSSKVFECVLNVRLSAGFGTAHRLAVNAILWAWAVAVPAFPVWAYGATFKAALFGLYPYIVSSVLFMAVTQCSHIQKETQTRAAINEEDFFKRQAMTSLDYSCGSSLWGFLTGGLNTQSLHHVAPSVHSSRYPDLYPQFYQVCLKHQCAPPQALHIGSALAKHLCYVYELGNGYMLPVPEM